MPETPKAGLKVIVARIIVGIMFSMLIVSFAIWGIGPIFQTGGRLRLVAEVGPVRITPQEFQDQYRRELRQLQTALQTQLDAQRARDLGIPERVVQEMVGRILFSLAARDAGVAVGDDVVRQAIIDNPSFKNAEGQFDRALFDSLLYNAGYSEDRFVGIMRDDVVRTQLSGAITAGATVASETVDALYRYRNERRVTETLTVPAASIKELPTPTEADLDAYHKAHAEAFTAPEYRAITGVELRASDLVDRMKVSDDQIKDEYESRPAEFKIPEERALRQILLPDEAAAKRAEAMLSEGQSFDKVAHEVTGKAPVDIGTVTETGVPTQELAKAAFELKEGGVSAPIPSPLGWHIVQVAKVTPGRTESLAEAKDRLSRQIALREAADAVFDLSNKLQDELGGGASLEDAARKLDLKPIKIEAVDSQGNGPDGKRVTSLPQDPKFLAAAFATESGRESDLVDDGSGGYFILRVDKVVPSALKPLAEVRDQVLAGWQQEQRLQGAEKVASALVESAKSGKSLAELAKEDGYAFANAQPFTRTGEGASPGLTPELIGTLFSAKVGDVVSAATPQGAVVAKLTEVMPSEAKADEAKVQRLRDQLRDAVGGDLLGAFAAALQKRYRVEINTDVIDSLVGS